MRPQAAVNALFLSCILQRFCRRAPAALSRQAHVDIQVQGFAIGLVRTSQASCYDASYRLKIHHLHRSFQVFAPLQQVRHTDFPVFERQELTLF
jgi:hypothetical protein